jgi:hypothetical protein
MRRAVLVPVYDWWKNSTRQVGLRGWLRACVSVGGGEGGGKLISSWITMSIGLRMAMMSFWLDQGTDWEPWMLGAKAVLPSKNPRRVVSSFINYTYRITAQPFKSVDTHSVNTTFIASWYTTAVPEPVESLRPLLNRPHC